MATVSRGADQPHCWSSRGPSAQSMEGSRPSTQGPPHSQPWWPRSPRKIGGCEHNGDSDTPTNSWSTCSEATKCFIYISYHDETKSRKEKSSTLPASYSGLVTDVSFLRFHAWRGTWDLTLQDSVIEAWQAVASLHDVQLRVSHEMIEKSKITGVGSAVYHLGHSERVFRPVSLRQILISESEAGKEP